MKPVPAHPITLAGWIQHCADRSPPEASQAQLELASEQSGTRLYSYLPQAAVWVVDWYTRYLHDHHLSRCSLPLVIPYLLDLGALLTVTPRLMRPPGIPAGLVHDYEQFYLKGHLNALAGHSVVEWLRGRLRGCRDGNLLGPIVARFIDLVFSRVSAVWQEYDASNGHASFAWDNRIRLLTGVAAQAAFLSRLGEVTLSKRILERSTDVSEAIFPLPDRFLMGSACVRPDAFEPDRLSMDLFRLCSRGQEYPETRRTIDPMHLRPGLPLRPENRGGDQVELRRVTRSTQLERFPDVLPQELALLRRNEGLRLLLHKQSRDGLLIWERQVYTEPIRRHRLLLCFLAHADSTHEALGDQAGFSSSAQAQTIIFDSLRDLAVQADDPTLTILVVVYLLRQRRRRSSQVWELKLDDLRDNLGGSRMDDMLAIEGLAPGYFLQPQRRRETIRSPGTYLRERCADFDPDLTLTVYLAPAEQLNELPELTAPIQNRPGVVLRSWGVRLLGRPGRIELARDRQRGSFESLSEMEFRGRLLADLLGPEKDLPTWARRATI